MSNCPEINRRRFLAKSTAAGAAAATTIGFQNSLQASTLSSNREPFAMLFAPHPGMFRATGGNAVVDQIEFAHDQGFRAWEQNGLGNEPAHVQEEIGKALADRGMQMGVFVAYASFDRPTFARKNSEATADVLKQMKSAVEIAKRCNAKWFTVVPGSVDQQFASEGQWNKYGGPRLAPGFQMANAIELLRRCAEILEPHGLTMVLEPLNWHTDHGGTLLRYSDQAYAICKAVNSPSCKILFDIYHQQITEGNLIPNIERCWDEIAYFQCGDNPGRKEPGTGEINYENVFKYIHNRSTKEDRHMIMGMEHGNSKNGTDGDQAVINAYRKVDPRD
jgi:hydroxypyruvate isomerase